MRKHLAKKTSLLCGVLLCCAALSFAEMTDVVILKNGGRIFGKILKMNLGRLTYSTDEMKVVNIDWMEIARISSKQILDIEMSTGQRYQGSLGESGEDGKIVIVTKSGQISEDIISVANITPLEIRFWDKFKGSLSFGFNLQKANSLRTITSSSDITYHTKKWETRFKSSTYLSNQEGLAKTTSNSASLFYNRFLPKLWSIGGLVQLQQNDELGLDLRSIIGLAGGRYLIKNNRMVLLGGAGFMVTNEKYTGSETRQYNLEALFSFGFQHFRYSDPDLNLSTSIQIYPNITDLGRVRIEFDINLYYEIFTSFYLTVSLFDHFDSRPPTGDSPIKNDYGLDLSIAWFFY